MFDGIAERAAVLCQPPLECLPCAQLDGIQAAGAPASGSRRDAGERAWLVGEPDGEGIGKRMRRIGGGHEHTSATPGFDNGPRRRARCFADPALAAVKQKPGERRRLSVLPDLTRVRSLGLTHVRSWT